LVERTLVTDTSLFSPAGSWLRRLLAVGVLAGALLLGMSIGPAGATTSACQSAVAELEQAIKSLQPAPGTKLSTAEQEQVRKQAGQLFATAGQQQPECKDDFATLAAKLRAEAQSKTFIKGTAFLGPIGWLWNNVYYRVFSGNDVMMALFGWALLLSPVILVVAAAWVMHGATAGLHKPYVPEHLRVDQ
jgi:hypothetical protein